MLQLRDVIINVILVHIIITYIKTATFIHSMQTTIILNIKYMNNKIIVIYHENFTYFIVHSASLGLNLCVPFPLKLQFAPYQNTYLQRVYKRLCLL